MKRKIYQQLADWKLVSNGKSALLIEGARRIGKSYIVEQFAKQEYKSYLKIDFANTSKAVQKLFEDISDLDLFFTQLQLHYKVTIQN